MQLQPDEAVLSSSNGNSIVLTNIRIYGNFREMGYYQKIYIYLEDIGSVQVIYKSFVFLIVLAAACGLFGLWICASIGEPGPEALASFGLGAIFLALWWFTRRRVIAIYPKGGKALEFSANQLKEDAADDFIETVLSAKTKRINILSKAGQYGPRETV